MKASDDYFRIHNWINYHHGSAKMCENEDCTSVNPKRFEWALKKGASHKRDIGNYIQLCPSCHRKYDYTDGQRAKQSVLKRGKPAKNKAPVTQLTLSGELVRKYASYTDAAKAVGGTPSAFTALKNGILKTYKAHLWQF